MGTAELKKVESGDFKVHEMEEKLKAIDNSMAVIQFKPDGTILEANPNFLGAVGYSLNEIEGNHHRIFCEDAYADSLEYKQFWKDLANGQSKSGTFKRITKDGSEIYIEASYNSLRDESGHVYKVIKFASDVTETVKLSRMANMVDKSPINTMMATPDGVITYMNAKSNQTLKKIEQYLPAPVEQLMNKSMDWLHKNPEHQRRLIKDPSNLPHRAIIEVGDNKLDLLVSAITSTDGEYLGPMVTWDVVTEKVELVDSLSATSKELGVAAEELLAVANQMASTAEETASQTRNVSAASEELNSGVQTVAANMEEMTASIKEITKQTNESSSETNKAAGLASNSNEIITKLGDSSQEIGNIIKVITSIAQQTNLLALNATIEAARAGEAGKGFAVVANEVKELAKQTASATVDISRKVETIQEDASSAVDSIGHITNAIDTLNGIATNIASSMEEQSATTSEVSRVVNEASEGVKQIDNNINQVSTAAAETGQGASQTQEAAKQLSKISENLQALVDKIKV